MLKADRHQHAGKAKLPGHSIAEDQEREERTDEAGVLARPSKPVEKPE